MDNSSGVGLKGRKRIDIKKEQKRQSLLEAAYELFLEKGVAKTSIDEIVKKAHVAKGTFYLYFHDKEHLADYLTQQISSDVLADAYRHVLENPKPRFADNCIELIDYVIEYFRANRLVLRLLERNFSWPMIREQFSLPGDPLWQEMAEKVKQSSYGRARSEDELFKSVYIIVEMIGSVCYSSIIEGKPDTIDAMKPVLYQMVRSILSEAQPASPEADGVSESEENTDV